MYGLGLLGVVIINLFMGGAPNLWIPVVQGIVCLIIAYLIRPRGQGKPGESQKPEEDNDEFKPGSLV